MCPGTGREWKICPGNKSGIELFALSRPGNQKESKVNPGIPSREYKLKLKRQKWAGFIKKVILVFRRGTRRVRGGLRIKGCFQKILKKWGEKYFCGIFSFFVSFRYRFLTPQKPGREWVNLVPGREWESVPGIFRDWPNLAKLSHSREWKPIPVPSRDETGSRSNPSFFPVFYCTLNNKSECTRLMHDKSAIEILLCGRVGSRGSRG